MPIFYALVARKTTVLTEFTGRSGNFPTVTRMLLGKITDGDQKMSYVYDKCVAAQGRALEATTAVLLYPGFSQMCRFPPCSCVFHYIVERGITYLCLADEKNKRRIPFLYLDDIKVRAWPLWRPRSGCRIAHPPNARAQAKFQTAYGERANTAIAFAMNADFARVLQDRMDFCNENPNADAFGKVKNQIEDVKGVMVENIEKVRRGG